jgi:hypothetical protein
MRMSLNLGYGTGISYTTDEVARYSELVLLTNYFLHYDLCKGGCFSYVCMVFYGMYLFLLYVFCC